MAEYPFEVMQVQEDPLQDKALLLERPFTKIDGSLAGNAKHFVPGEPLQTAINVAVAVGQPLLITGEPGTGKTQAAYYAAYKLGLKLIHFQVKSDSTAHDLLYNFDTVLYFQDAHMLTAGQKTFTGRDRLVKSDYLEQRPLWEAFEVAKEQKAPAVLLLDEIDKAPRDFPNDLLHELDQMSFHIPETDEEKKLDDPALAPIIFITSNSERRLPEPFLRRCVYHHIEFDDEIVRKAVEARREREFGNLPQSLIDTALQRFLELRDRSLRKRPATGELLIWLRVLALTLGAYPEQLDQDLSRLPYLGVLIKDHQDRQELEASGRR